MPREKKRKKSVYGGGSVYQRKSDGRYVAHYKHPETGKHIRRYAHTESDANQLLEQIKDEIRQGKLVQGPRQKLKDYLAHWLEDVQRPKLRPGPYAVQKSIIYHQIIPELGEIELTKLTPQRLQRFYKDKVASGLEIVSVKNINKVLHTAMENAVRWDIVARNVCDRVDLPRTKKRKRMILTRDQIKHILEVAEQHGDMDAFIKLAITTGLRHSEMLALRWEDINFETRILQIRHSVTYVSGQGFVLLPPKSESGERTFVLPQLVIKALRKHQELQDAEKSRKSKKWRDNNVMFAGPRGDYRHLGGNLRRYRKVLAEANFPDLTVQDLRHNISTFVQKELKYSTGFAQTLLGHSSPDVTLWVYTHMEDPTLLQPVMDEIDKLFG